MPLYLHQQTARERYRHESIIPLFFDPGLGKTCTALTIAQDKYEDGEIDCVLVIAPNKVDKQWAIEQVPLWVTVDYNVYCNKKDKKPLPYYKDKLNIVCVNIDQFSTTAAYMRYAEWVNAHDTMIILDEATKIKHPKSLRTQRLLTIFNDVTKRRNTVIASVPKTKARCILTGTPITEGAFDVWSMFEFLDPGYFGMNQFQFQNHYGLFYSIVVNGRTIRVLLNEETWARIHAMDSFETANLQFGVSLSAFTYIKGQDHYQGPYRNIEELRQKICETAMFVRITDVVDMPERVYDRKLLEMSPEQAKAYYEMENLLLTSYKDKDVTAKAKIVMYMRLQQIASGFISADPDDDVEDPRREIVWFDKVPKMDQLLMDVEEASEPTIIVCHFSAEASRIYDELTAKGYKCCLRTGWSSIGSEEDWKAGKYQFMVANEKVIAMGFNYQISHHMIFYSCTFSLEDRIQIEAREWRIGQTKTCIYTDYVMIDTIEMKIYAVLKQKKSLSDYVRDNSVSDMLTKRDEVFDEEYKDVLF